jgi:hypothetical protein
MRHNLPGFPEKVNIISHPGKFLFSNLTGWPDYSDAVVLRVSHISSRSSCLFPGISHLLLLSPLRLVAFS